MLNNNLNDEDRGCCCSPNPANNPMQCGCCKIPTYSYEFTNISPEIDCEEKEITREEMLEQIRCLSFAIVELAEYLDTHPDDQKALCLHREYCKRYKILTDQYQKVFGPLSIYFPCNKWRWLEEPWPWERGGM